MEYVPAKTILSGYREQTEWFGCHYNMNLYRGCCHGCIYCDSRSECYGIEDFDRVRAKKGAMETLERELRAQAANRNHSHRIDERPRIIPLNQRNA